MYKPGDLEIAPAGCPVDEDGDCEAPGHDHPYDIRSREGSLFGGAFLPHSCDKWVIGGPEQIRALIADLEAALVALEKP